MFSHPYTLDGYKIKARYLRAIHRSLARRKGINKGQAVREVASFVGLARAIHIYVYTMYTVLRF